MAKMNVTFSKRTSGDGGGSSCGIASTFAASAAAMALSFLVVSHATTHGLTPSYSMLSKVSPSSTSSSSSSSSPFGVVTGASGGCGSVTTFTLHESTNGDSVNGSDDSTNNIDLKSKSDTDIVNGIHYPFPSPPPPPVSAAGSVEKSAAAEQYSALSYFTETSSSSQPSPNGHAPATPTTQRFLSVDGNGSGGLMGRSAGTGGTDATLMLGDTAQNKATPVDSGSVHLPDTQQILKHSLAELSGGNSIIRGSKIEQPESVITNRSDGPVARPTVPRDDDSAIALHVSNTVFDGTDGMNVIPTVLKRYVPAPKNDGASSIASSLLSSPSAAAAAAGTLKGAATGGSNHFPSPTPQKFKVRRYIPGQDDNIFKHPESKKSESTSMLPTRKLKPYERPVLKPAVKIALPAGAVAVSTTTTTSAALTRWTSTGASPEAATTKAKSTKLVRIVSEETTSSIPYDNPKDRYCNEYTSPTSATLHLKTGLQVNTPVSLWQPRDKFLDR